ncbi:gamma-glutamyl-gamma-aminobutyrate hydrolase family protein [Leucobacter chinensis]|uniref:gamma-glutamyl-gamma-aminobutyrate hydrolase family protein n=1 Tax=Leucobacter chinensis TaxID=2851010 RepID=UPI001C22EFF1|nr:gamma-glutamyl-gamma-aminobutyrate hydrolase family protein [Leucobacter chinensis]
MQNQTETVTGAGTASRPVRILASYVMDAPNVSADYADELHALASNAARAIVTAADDAQVMFVNANDPSSDVERSLTNIDGVVVLGGSDVDPSHYTSDEAAIAKVEATQPKADEFELALITAAVERGLPVLGICRGSQAINVAFGGSLITDLGADTMHRIDATDSWTNHDIEIAPDTRLGSIYGEANVSVRSAHHQAVDTVAPGLRASAVAADGIVEAVEANDDRWVLGVQWHPEEHQANTHHMNLLAQAFITEARKH